MEFVYWKPLSSSNLSRSKIRIVLSRQRTPLWSYSSICPRDIHRHVLSFKIYAKYLRHSSPAHLEFVPEKVRSDTYEYLENARQDRELLGPEFFLELQRSCFKEIFDHTFLKLKKEHELRQDVAQLMLFLGVEYFVTD